MFEVIRTKTGERCQVYSVQMIPGQNAVGQIVPGIVFLIYNPEESRWELVEAGEFTPIGVEPKKEKKAVTGSDSILLSHPC